MSHQVGLLLMLWVQAQGSPIISPDSIVPPLKPINPISVGPPPNVCVLPKELDYSGLSTLVEDCEQLSRFTAEPPIDFTHFSGASVYMCCPLKPIYEDGLKFPLEGVSTSDDAESEEEEYVILDVMERAARLEKRCARLPDSQCTEIQSCSNEFSENPPVSCGWNLETGAEKICCPKIGTNSLPLLPKKYGDYDCEDFTEHCKRFASKHPDSCKPHHKSFYFMKFACMKSCDICKDRGCRDEFSECDSWAKRGFCVRSNEFMLLHCRESCGTCGFRSPRNGENQIEKDKDYTDITSQNFYCGEGLSNIEGNEEKKFGVRTVLIDLDILSGKKKRSPQLDKKEPESKSQEDEDRQIICGSILVSDRFMVFAGHCSTLFDNNNLDAHIRSIILRDGSVDEEQIEIRRVFVHPEFHFPSLYYDIAIAELGRRIIYDFEVFGDSPSCISTGQPIIGRSAISQGYGFTELGEVSSDLRLETNVTIISNEDCTTWLHGNTTDNLSRQTTLREQLSDGINEQMLCTTGIYNDTSKVWSGPCEGDSGGPLYVNFGGRNGERKQTLEGIVSGALTCGGNIPAWYTKVFPFRSWIECIIREVNKNRPSGQVERTCLKFAKKFQPQNKIM